MPLRRLDISVDLKLKLAVVFVFTLIKITTVIVRSLNFGGQTGLDASWLMGLATYFQQGALSGRDFHFTYGPAAQVLSWISTLLTPSGSAFDAFRMMGVLYGALSTLTLGAALLLYDRISWKHTALVYSVMQAMNLFSEVPSVRPALLLLCAAFAYRIVAAGTPRRQMQWTVACGVLSFASQLFTPEIALMGTVVVVGTLVLNFLYERNGRNVALALVFISVLAFLNLALVTFFRLSSPDYGGLFDYQRYIAETMRGYNNTLGVEWELDKSRTNFLALLVAYTILTAVIAGLRSSPRDSCLVAGVLLAGLLYLKGAFVRSDIGHIASAASPFVFAFLLLAKRGWQPRFGRAVWVCFGAGLLWAWPLTHWNGLDFLKGFSGQLAVHRVLREITTATYPPESILPPQLAKPEFRSRTDVPILPFPYENYMPAVLKRPLLAPVLQSYSASTPALQRFYVDAVEKQRIGGGVDIVYGVDSTAAWPVDGVQTISRVPLIFEYIYRHFELASNREYKDGHYILTSRKTPRELVIEELSFAKDIQDDAAGVLRLSRPSACGLVRLDMRMTYSWRKFFFRPAGIAVFFRNGTDVVASTVIRSAEPDRSFTTYVSLLQPEHFHRLFNEGSIPSRAWDSVAYRQTATDQLSARPWKIEISSVQCVDGPTFRDGDSSWHSSELSVLFPPEVMHGAPQAGYAVVIPDSGSSPEVTARLGFAGTGFPMYADISVEPAAVRHQIKATAAVAKDIGIAIANPQPWATEVEIKHGGGSNPKTVSVSLPPRGHLSKSLAELLGLSGHEMVSETLELVSEAPISVFALSSAPWELKSLSTANADTVLRGPGIFPQFVQNGGWATAFIISNPNEVPAGGRIEIFSSDGNPMPVTLNGVTSSTHKYAVAPKQVSVLSPGGIP